MVTHFRLSCLKTLVERPTFEIFWWLRRNICRCNENNNSWLVDFMASFMLIFVDGRASEATGREHDYNDEDHFPKTGRSMNYHTTY